MSDENKKTLGEILAALQTISVSGKDVFTMADCQRVIASMIAPKVADSKPEKTEEKAQ